MIQQPDLRTFDSAELARAYVTLAQLRRYPGQAPSVPFMQPATPPYLRSLPPQPPHHPTPQPPHQPMPGPGPMPMPQQPGRMPMPMPGPEPGPQPMPGPGPIPQPGQMPMPMPASIPAARDNSIKGKLMRAVEVVQNLPYRLHPSIINSAVGAAAWFVIEHLNEPMDNPSIVEQAAFNGVGSVVALSPSAVQAAALIHGLKDGSAYRKYLDEHAVSERPIRLVNELVGEGLPQHKIDEAMKLIGDEFASRNEVRRDGAKAGLNLLSEDNRTLLALRHGQYPAETYRALDADWSKLHPVFHQYGQAADQNAHLDRSTPRTSQVASPPEMRPQQPGPSIGLDFGI